MTPASQPADRDRVREAVRSRYGRLARVAQAGRAVAGCIAGAPSCAGYRGGLPRAGSAGITITAPCPAATSIHAAIIRAARP